LKQPKRYTVTAALPYANGPAHIGHIAGVYLPADIYVRYQRAMQRDVLFICGSDEHGAAITIRAKKEGISPRQIVDKYHQMLKDGMSGLGISFDVYHRTSSELHHETAAEYFKVLEEKGVFEIEEREQYFDEEHQQFLADRYITGECPHCHYENAYGDQCENCGNTLSPSELINPRSTMSGSKPVLKKTSHWYLPMQDHESWLRTWLEEGKIEGEEQHDVKEWKDHVLGQCRSWVEAGLLPRAMTRDLDWGVQVPVAGADGKVLYVWLDAPIGYISATKQWALDTGKDWQPWWKDKESKLLHFIGKDNIVFHCIIFPILLKAHGDFILPDNIPANAFMNLEGRKLSTSKNWAVWVNEYLSELEGRQDELRYVLTALAPENRDSEFTWKLWQEKNNNELVKGPGNFVNRTLTLINKNQEGKILAPGTLEEVDKEFLSRVKAFPAKVGALIEQYKFREAQATMMALPDAGDKYYANTTPWNLLNPKKDTYNPERGATVLYVAAQATAVLSILMEPFMPFRSEKLAGLLNFKYDCWADASKDELLPANHQIQPQEHLFTPIPDEVVEAQVTKLKESSKAPASNPDAPAMKEGQVSFEDFNQLDLRVGTILEAKRIPKRDRLLELKVDIGLEQRTVVSGIAEQYQPDDLIGKKVSLLINLKPAKLGGVLSEGMILMAQDEAGKLTFLDPGTGIKAGNIIK